MFVGAATPRPAVVSSTPLARMDSEATLVDEATEPSRSTVAETRGDAAMDVDAGAQTDHEEPELKSGIPTRCSTRRRSTSGTEPSPHRPRNRACSRSELPPVSVRSNPKPLAPVATSVDFPCPPGHSWKIPNANGHARRYICEHCGLNIQEKKKDGFWVPHELTFIKRRPGTVIPQSSSPPESTAILGNSDTPAEPALSDIAERGESDTEVEDAMSIYESAEEDEPDPSPPNPPRELASPVAPRRSSAGRSSLGTHSDAPSSLAAFPPLRRLPARPGSDISTPIGAFRRVSSGSRRASDMSALRTPLSPIQSELPASPVSPPPIHEDDLQLVANNPKPKVPVAGGYTPDCPGRSQHAWEWKWSGPTQRHYICLECAYVVKERKYGNPLRWTPAN